MRQPFHKVFSVLAAEHILSPKEVAFYTGKSGSTVYRWLRGDSTPDIDDFVDIVKAAEPLARERLLAWLSQDLQMRVEWQRSEQDAALADRSLHEVTTEVKDKTLAVVEKFLEVVRWHETEVGPEQTLSPKQFAALEERLDDVLREVTHIKRLHHARMIERRRARHGPEGE